MGLDSIELLMEVEKHFVILIPDREAEKAYSVGKLVDCVANILGVKHYNFALREKTFALVKHELLKLDPKLKEFSINRQVADFLPIQNQELIIQLENKTGLKLPGIDTRLTNREGLLSKEKNGLQQ